MNHPAVAAAFATSTLRWTTTTTTHPPTTHRRATVRPDEDDSSDDAKQSLRFILNRKATTTDAVPVSLSQPPAVGWSVVDPQREEDPLVRMGLRSRRSSSQTPHKIQSMASTRRSTTRIGAEREDATAKPVAPSRRQAPGKSKAATGGTGKIKPPTASLTYEQKRLARQCTVDDCTNYTINNGRCFRHGGGKQCTFENCRASAKIAGLCWKHGGSMPCVVDGCDRRGKSRGRCWSHGGGTLCQSDACAKVAVSNGCCWAHGGGKRCQFDGCQRPAYERTLNYCPKHFQKFENGEEVLEL